MSVIYEKVIDIGERPIEKETELKTLFITLILISGCSSAPQTIQHTVTFHHNRAFLHDLATCNDLISRMVTKNQIYKSKINEHLDICMKMEGWINAREADQGNAVTINENY